MKKTVKYLTKGIILTAGIVFAISCSENVEAPETTKVNNGFAEGETEVVAQPLSPEERRKTEEWLRSLPPADTTRLKLTQQRMSAVGGNSGQEFDAYSDCNSYLKGIYIYAEGKIDGIVMVFEDVNGGGETQLGRFGSMGTGQLYGFPYSPREVCTGIQVRYGHNIDCIWIQKDKGPWQRAGTHNNGGNQTITFSFSASKPLIGLHGKADTKLKRLGFWRCVN